MKKEKRKRRKPNKCYRCNDKAVENETIAMCQTHHKIYLKRINKLKRKPNDLYVINDTGIFFLVICGMILFMFAGLFIVIVTSDIEGLIPGYHDLYLHKEEINGIRVYSDVPEFSRLKKHMDELNITVEQYPTLGAVVYYQNETETDFLAYRNSKSCDGSYIIPLNIINLHRCDDIIPVRNDHLNERQILAHELGHHVHEIIYPHGEETWADLFALNLTERNSTKVKNFQQILESHTRPVFTGNGSSLTEVECCYPSDCPQAVNNPENCDCRYPIECSLSQKSQDNHISESRKEQSSFWFD